MVVGAVALGDQAGPVELVEAALLEADREGAQRLARLGRGQGGDAAGVDPAGEQHPDRHVGDQVGADRVARGRSRSSAASSSCRPRATLVGRRPAAAARSGGPATSPPLPAEQMPRGQLAGLGEDRQRRRDRVEGEVGGDRLGVDRTREARLLEHRLQLRGEGEPCRDEPVVERLDPEAVAGQQQPPLALVPEGDREHPPQPLDEAVAVLLVEVDQHLGVAVGREAVPAALQLRASARGSCRSRRSGRRRRCRPRWRSAGRRRRGR